MNISCSQCSLSTSVGLPKSIAAPAEAPCLQALREFAGGDTAVKSVRWLEFEDTGKFKGCGFVQFYTVVSWWPPARLLI